LLIGLVRIAWHAVAEPLEREPPRFTDRPRALHTADELAAWKADPARTNDLAKALQQADRILADGVTPVPEKEGQWIFYYACPKDNAGLKAETPERHVCPACKTVYEDERTAAAYRTVLNHRMEKEIASLALAYALSGESRYAEPVRGAFLALARLYPTWDRHDRWGRRGLLALTGGRRYCQLLDEALGLITLAQTYDLVASAPCFSEDDRRTIEDKLLRYIALEIQGRELFAGSRNNHQTWFNAAYAVAGLVLADESMLSRAIYGKTGLLWQLRESVTPDGLWYEGTLSYHFYALQAIRETLDAARRAGWSFADHPRLKSLWLGPVALAWPDGSFPVLNDGDPASLARYRGFYEWGASYFQDPSLAAVGSTNAAASVPVESAALTGAGLVVLRRGRGTNAVCAMLDYGEHGGHHGHPDKLNLMLYAHGREFILDPGRLTYSVPEYETWCRTTLAHNTVVVNGRNQAAKAGDLWYFTNGTDYAACLAATDQVYPGWELARFLVLTDLFLVDVFAVRGDREAELDWFLHVRGTPESEGVSTPMTDPLGKGPGYQHLRDVLCLEADGLVSLAFSQGADRMLRLRLPGADSDLLYQGVGIGYSLKDRVPFLLRRRRAASTVFVTVYDWSGDGLVTSNITLLPVQSNGSVLPAWAAVGLEVSGPEGIWHLGLDMRREPVDTLRIEGQPLERLRVGRLSSPTSPEPEGYEKRESPLLPGHDWSTFEVETRR
jgi:hypothetical protein